MMATFRKKVLLLVNERSGQLARGQLRLLEGQPNHCLSDRRREFVLHVARRRLAIFQGPGAARQITFVLAIESRPW
jgi:hypothetical protein